MGRLTKNQEKILAYVRQSNTATTPEQVAKALDIAWQTAQSNLLMLVEQNKIKFEKIGRQNLFMKKGSKSMIADVDYKKLFEEAPQPSWIFDRETLEFLAVNNQAIELFGHSQEEFLGMRLTDLLESDHDKELLEARVFRKQGFNPVLVQYRTLGIWKLMTKSGRMMKAEIVARPVQFQGRLANVVTLQPIEAGKDAVPAAEARYPLAGVVPSMIWTAKPDGTITFANHLWYEYTGLSHELTKHIMWETIIHPEDVGEWKKLWEPQREGEVVEGNFRVLRADGVYHWHLARNIPIKNEKNEITMWAGSMIDIHKYRLEEELHEAESKFRILIGAIKEYAIFMLDRTGKVISWNPGAERIKGWKAEEVIGKSYEIFFPEEDRRIGRPAHILQKAMSAGTYSEQGWRVKKDGTQFMAEITLNAIYGQNGELVGFAKITRDITEKKEKRLTFLAEVSEQLNASIQYEQTLKTLATRLVPEMADWCGVDMVREDGGIDRLAVVHINPAKVELAYAVHEEFPFNPAAPTGVAKVLRTGMPEFFPVITQEMINALPHTPRQRELLNELNLSSVVVVPLIARGKTLGAITLAMAESKRRYTEEDVEFAQDVARRAAMAVDNARLYTESQQALALRDDFLSIASHELKTPVTSVKAFLQALEQRMSKPEQFDFKKNREYMHLSIKQVDRLGAIINDLLDITRINKGKMQYDFQILSIGPMVAEVVERMSVSFPSHIIACKLQDLTAKVRIDALRFEQVLTNLITNAVKYSPTGSVIDISTYGEDEDVCIAIKDRGIGISQEEQELIFNRYYRTKDAISSKASGMGIGLYIASQLIDAHNGKLTVNSTPGQGSTFIITLPRAEAK
jgi:PAS domain S-box-containing protein